MWYGTGLTAFTSGVRIVGRKVGGEKGGKGSLLIVLAYRSQVHKRHGRTHTPITEQTPKTIP
jgi:hypothetical protein